MFRWLKLTDKIIGFIDDLSNTGIFSSHCGGNKKRKQQYQAHTDNMAWDSSCACATSRIYIECLFQFVGFLTAAYAFRPDGKEIDRGLFETVCKTGNSHQPFLVPSLRQHHLDQVQRIHLSPICPYFLARIAPHETLENCFPRACDKVTRRTSRHQLVTGGTLPGTRE